MSQKTLGELFRDSLPEGEEKITLKDGAEVRLSAMGNPLYFESGAATDEGKILSELPAAKAREIIRVIEGLAKNRYIDPAQNPMIKTGPGG